ncbi:COP23 domain-containing protein [Nostoc sp. NIES-2111]
MLSKSWKFVLLGSVGLSFIVGNSVALAQYDDGVVVPTVPGSSTSTDPNYPYPVDTSTNTYPSTNVDGNVRFSCQQINGQPTVVYQPQSQPGQIFPWAAPRNLGGGWDAQKRCQAIATRLETYRPDGLQELQVSVLNNENVVCVTTDANQSCRIVFTVPRNQDPYTVRNNVFQNLVTADNGQQTTAVNTYRGNNSLYNLGGLVGNRNNRISSSRSGINLKPYLDTKDGGTARNLRNGIAIRRQSPTRSNNQNQAPTRLNPDRFR